MKKLLVNLASLYMASATVAYCQQLITFDDLSASADPTSINNGYAGLDWNNFDVLNVPDYSSTVRSGTGYSTGLVSPPNVALNGFGDPASISAVTPFALNSGYFTAAFINGLSLEVIGLNGATTEYDNTYTLSTSGPLQIDFPETSVTEVQFVSSYTGNPYDTTQFALDNLDVTMVPEPSTGLMFGMGLGMLLGRLRRKNQSAHIKTI